MDNLIFSFNVVMPVFLIIAVGYFIKSIGMIDDQFVNTAIKFNFRVGISTLLFKNIYGAELGTAFNGRLLIFTFASIVGSVIVLWLIVPIFVKDKKKTSAMIHTIYRSNFVLLGIPLATNMFGEANIAPISLLIPVAVPVFNLLAVVILAAFDEKGYENRGQQIISTMVKIIKNPLILGSAAAILMKLFSLRLPQSLESAVYSVASLGTPLALITLGAQLNFKNALENLKYTIIATLGRLVVVPFIIVMLAIFLGFRGYELGGVFILFSSPSAVSSYVMAKEMNSDHKLTGDVVLLTTLFSMFTIFAGIYLLKTFGLI